MTIKYADEDAMIDERLVALNARMRRIDLFCKLVGPLVISSIAIASTLVAIYATLAMNVVSVLVEYICIESVRRHPTLWPSTATFFTVLYLTV